MQFTNIKGIVFIIAICICVIGAALFGNIENVYQKNETVDSTESVFTVLDHEIVTVDVKNQTGSFAFERCEEIYKNADEKEIIEIVYKVQWDHEKTLDQEKVKSFLRDFYDFRVLRTVSENATEDELEKYGFKGDWNIIRFNQTDGSSHAFVLGGISEDNKERYVMKEGYPEIYTMPRAKEESFLNGLDTYRERRLGSFGTYTLLSFSVTDKGERKLGIRYKNQNDTEVATTNNIQYVMVLPHNGAVDINKFNEIIKHFDEVVVEDFVQENLDSLSKYGLNEDNALKVVIQDDGKNRHDLFFGNIDEKGNVYTIYGDNKFVFTMKPDMYNAVKDIKADDLLEKYANIYIMDNVSKIIVKHYDQEYIFSIIRGNKVTYKINGKDALDKGFKSICMAINDLRINELVEKFSRDKEVLDITFYLKDGTIKTTKYYEYDNINYGVYTPDGTYGLADKSRLDGIIEVVKMFDENPQIEP